MKLLSQIKENEVFERSLRENYSNEVCDIVIEWTEEALAYVFKETSDENLFVLGVVNRDNNTIEYTEEEFTLDDIITRVISEMEYALDGTESRDIIEKELKIVSEAL